MVAVECQYVVDICLVLLNGPFEGAVHDVDVGDGACRELFPKYEGVMRPRVYFVHTSSFRKHIAPVGVFDAIDLDASVKDSYAHELEAFVVLRRQDIIDVDEDLNLLVLLSRLSPLVCSIQF